ncbi:hypothetical protein D9V37_00060 [Nocardioides mangrovicus]|uniref:NlpC/P60 domain-containing protein n=1 Tax=Nocardioides mangrovicus TaxID=2478913 RepID=A0A3L8P6S8_9ACTN|nr:C40 family peptidase [Nocardioides mangrovicus]RLV50433.1 hypothetical protein D9V37_00060 [Nocardioides mangrovicus]
MRTTARGLTATATTLVVSGALCLATGLTGGSAVADPGTGDPSTPSAPSQAQVDAARAAADAKAGDVASMRRSLVAANARLDSASTRAEIATEKYDAARWHLQQAQTQLHAAQAQATSAEQQVSSQRSAVASLVNDNFRGSAQLDQLSVIVQASGPQSVLERLGLLQSATSSMNATYDRYRAALSQARVARAKAKTAEKAAASLAKQASATRATAAAAQADAEQDASALSTQRDRLVKQLAAARGISVALAKKRQDALEQAAQVKAQQEAAAAAAAQQAAQEQAAQEAAQQQAQQQASASPTPSSTPSASSSPSSTPSSSPSSSSSSSASSTPTSSPTSDPTDGSTPTPAPTGNAAQAIAYAKAQIGKPYKWAAAGPSSFDCSGLTMRAWEAAGVSLPHYSAGQYAATTHITRSQLQPGDLIFWGSSPGSIHHVAMYLGDGMMIHAPRTGQDVMIASIDYWIAPNYFSRP